MPKPAPAAESFTGGLPDFEAAFEQEVSTPAFPDFESPVDEEEPASYSLPILPKSEFGGLQMFVPVYRALAGILALASVGGLLYAIYAAVTLKEAAERTPAITGSLAVFIGGGLLAALHLVLAELIRLALALEERSRGG